MGSVTLRGQSVNFHNTDTGFPYSYGVFRAYFFTHAPFEGVLSVSVAGVMLNVILASFSHLLVLS